MSALDEIRKIPYQKRTKLDLAIMFYGDEQTADADDLEKAEEAAAELLKLRETLLEIDGLLSGSLPVTKQVKELIARLNLNAN